MLEIDHLALDFLRYRGLWQREAVPCLRDVSLSLVRGEVHAVVGASGAGKSLMAQAIIGLLPGNARLRGELRLDGAPLDAPRQAALRGKRLALIPQSLAALDPLVRSHRQVAWAAQRAGVSAPRAAAERALTEVGMVGDSARRHPHQLSGGMARRVLLAMATAGEADWLIADEPSVGLDPAHRDGVLDQLRRLADAGKGVLLITHDLRHALSVADRVTVFHAGTTLETAPAGAFQGRGEALASGYARALWRALPDNDFARPPLHEVTQLA